MKANLRKLRLTRTILAILAGCFVLSGTSAAAVYYFGRGIIYGEAVASASGLACTNIETVTIERNGQRWVRKFVRASTSDGLARARTALRVASIFSKSQEADLYQVVVVDEHGPATRGAMRGRAIGADVLFTPHPGNVTGMDVPFKVRYVDGAANATGLFSGARVELSLEEVNSAVLALDDHTDCASPVVDGEATAGGHGPAPAASGHGDAAKEQDEHAPEGHEAESREPTMEDFARLGTDAAIELRTGAVQAVSGQTHSAEPHGVESDGDAHDSAEKAADPEAVQVVVEETEASPHAQGH